MRLPVEGMPEDRKERLLANLIQGKDQLLRYLLFLLAAGRDASQSGQDLARLLARGDAPRDRQPPALFLLESLLRALHRNRPQVERVASLITELRRGGADSELLGEEFDRIWNPIWELARREEGE